MAIIKDLYPPIIEGYLPAYKWVDDFIKIYFDISNYNSIDQITAVQIAIFDSEKNISVVKNSTGIIYLPVDTNEIEKDKEKNLYYITVSKNLLNENYQADRLYKVQLRFTGIGASYSKENEKIRYQNILNDIKNNYEDEVSPYLSTMANYYGTEGSSNAGGAADVITQQKLAETITGFWIGPNPLDEQAVEDQFNYDGKTTYLRKHIYNVYRYAPLTNADIIKDNMLLYFLLGPYNYTQVLDEMTGEVVGLLPVTYANWKSRFGTLPAGTLPFSTLDGGVTETDPVCIPENFNFNFFYLSKNTDASIPAPYQVVTYKLTIDSNGVFSVLPNSVVYTDIYTDKDGYIYKTVTEQEETTVINEVEVLDAREKNGQGEIIGVLPIIPDYILGTLAFLYDEEENKNEVNEYSPSKTEKFRNFTVTNLVYLKNAVKVKGYQYIADYYEALWKLMAMVADPQGSTDIDTYLNTLQRAYKEEFDDSALIDDTSKDRMYVSSNLQTNYAGSSFYHYDSITNTVSVSPDFLNKAETYVRGKIAEKDNDFQNLSVVQAIESKYDIILSDAAAKLRVLLSENPSDTKTSYLAWVRAQNQKIAREICKYHNIYSSYFGGINLPTGTASTDAYVYDYDGNIICGFKDYVNTDATIGNEGDGSIENFEVKGVRIPANVQANKTQILEGSNLDKTLILSGENGSESYDVSLVTRMGDFDDVPDSYDNVLLDIGKTEAQQRTEYNYLQDQYTDCYIACYQEDTQGQVIITTELIAIEPDGTKTSLIDLSQTYEDINGDLYYKPFDENIFSKLYTFLSDEDKSKLRYISVDTYNKTLSDIDEGNDHIYDAYWRLKTRLTGYKNKGTSKTLGDNDYTVGWIYTDYDSKENVYIPKIFLTIINRYYEDYIRLYSFIYKKYYLKNSKFISKTDVRADAIFNNYFKAMFPPSDDAATMKIMKAGFLAEAREQISLFLNGDRFDPNNNLSHNYTKKIVTTVTTKTIPYKYNKKWKPKTSAGTKISTVTTVSEKVDAEQESATREDTIVTNYYYVNKNSTEKIPIIIENLEDFIKADIADKKATKYVEEITTNVYTSIMSDTDLYYFPNNITSETVIDNPFDFSNDYINLFTQLTDSQSTIDTDTLDFLKENFKNYVYNTLDSSLVGQANAQFFLQSVDKYGVAYDSDNGTFKKGNIGNLLTKMKKALGKLIQCEHDIKMSHYILKATNSSKLNSEGTGNYNTDNLRKYKWFVPTSLLTQICGDDLATNRSKAAPLDPATPAINLKYCPLDGQFNLNANIPDNNLKIVKKYEESIYMGDDFASNGKNPASKAPVPFVLNTYEAKKTYKNYIDARSNALNQTATLIKGNPKKGTGGYYARLSTQAAYIQKLKSDKQTEMNKNTSLYSQYVTALSDYNNKLAEKNTEIDKARQSYRDEYVSDISGINYLDRLNEIVSMKTTLETYYSGLQNAATQMSSTTLTTSISNKISDGYNKLLTLKNHASNEQVKLNGGYTWTLVLKNTGLYAEYQSSTTVSSAKAKEIAIISAKVTTLNEKYLNQLTAFYSLVKTTFDIPDEITTTNVSDYFTALDNIFAESGNFNSTEFDQNPSLDWYSYYVDYFSEWSTVCLIKPITPPEFTVSNLELPIDTYDENARIFFGSVPAFIGTYNQVPASQSTGVKEELSYYTFTLYDADDLTTPLGDSPYTQYIQNSDTSNIQYICNYNFELNKDYIINYAITTENGYTANANYLFKLKELSNAQLPFSIYCCADNDEARVVFVINSIASTTNNYNRYKIQRTDETEQYKIWHDVLNYQYVQSENTVYLYDYSIESDKEYQYRIISDNELYFNAVQIIQRNDDLLHANLDHSHSFLENNENNVLSNYISVSFEYTYLVANGQQLNIKFNNTIQNFKYVIAESKQEPIDSEFPFITKNGKLKYRTFPISSLISLEENENETFISSTQYSNLNDIYAKERAYREAVYDFLYGNKYFLYKSATEGNIIIKLMDINFAPEQRLGRLIYSLNANAYECYKFEPNNIINLNIQPLKGFTKEGHIYTDGNYYVAEGSDITTESPEFIYSLQDLGMINLEEMVNTSELCYNDGTVIRKIEKLTTPLTFVLSFKGNEDETGTIPLYPSKYISVSKNGEAAQLIVANMTSEYDATYLITYDTFDIDDEIDFRNIYQQPQDELGTFKVPKITIQDIHFDYSYSNCDDVVNEKVPFLVTELKDTFSGYLSVTGEQNIINYLTEKYSIQYENSINGVTIKPIDIEITNIVQNNSWTTADVSVLLEYYSN